MKNENIIKDVSWGKSNKIFFTLDNKRCEIIIDIDIWENENIEKAKEEILKTYPNIENIDFTIQ